MTFPYRSTRPRPLAADPWLQPYLAVIDRRRLRQARTEAKLTGGRLPLADFASGHEYFGLHFRDGRWIFRE